MSTNEEVISRAVELEGAKRCLIYPGPIFNMRNDGETLFVESPKTVNMQ